MIKFPGFFIDMSLSTLQLNKIRVPLFSHCRQLTIIVLDISFAINEDADHVIKPKIFIQYCKKQATDSSDSYASIYRQIWSVPISVLIINNCVLPRL